MSQECAVPRPGETFRCEACGRESIAKLQKVMDGWRCTGEATVCAFCKAPVAAPPASAEGTAPGGAGAQDAAALKRLASLLDAQPAERLRFKDMSKGRFCKDCKHFLRHPFNRRCLLHDRPVEPMDDCADFAPRPPEEPEAGTAAGDAKPAE